MSSGNFLSSDHRFVCEAFAKQEPTCNKEGIIQVISECSGYMRDYILPNIIEYGEETTRPAACKGFVNYKECVNAATEKICPKSRLSPTDAAQIESYKDQLYQKVNWTCLPGNSHLSDALCNVDEIQMNLTTCLGFIDNILNSKKLKKTIEECRKLTLFHECVKYHTNLPCSGMQKVLESKRVQYYTQTISKYVSEICDAPTEPDTCIKKELVPKLAECYSFIRYKVIPRAKFISDSSELDESCMAVRSYQACVQNVVESTCNASEDVMSDDDVWKYAVRHYGAYNWTCRDSSYNGKAVRHNFFFVRYMCRKEFLLGNLTECVGFITISVIPMSKDKTNPLQLRKACNSLLGFQRCVLSRVLSSCQYNSAVLETPEIRRYTHELYDQYKWVCDVPDTSDIEEEIACNDLNIVQHLKNCYPFVAYNVIPNVQHTDIESKIRTACVGVRDYQLCINTVLQTCKHNATSLEDMVVRYYTNEVFSKYNWTCETGIFCRETELIKNLTHCNGFLTYKVLPNIVDKHHYGKLHVACKGIKDYQKCLDYTIDMKCRHSKILSKDNIWTKISKSYQEYKWACDAAMQDTECDEQKLEESLNECIGIVEYDVKPYSDNPRDKERIKTACMNLREAQNCAKLAMFQVCDNLAVPDSANIKRLLYRIIQKYNWTCTLAVDYKAQMVCDKSSLLENITECMGFITISQPSQFHSSGSRRSELLCSHYQDYRHCVADKITSACQTYEDLLEHPDVVNATTTAVTTVKTACSTKVSTGSLCSTTSLRKQYATCTGYLRKYAIPRLHDTSSRANLKIGCKYLESYKKCLALKTDITCTKLKNWANNPVKRQFERPLEMFETLCHRDAHCEPSNIVKEFEQCSGILQYNLIPFSLDKGNSERLEVACSALRAYQQCLAIKLSPCEARPGFVSNLEIRKFTVNTVDQYKWVCDYVPQAICEESEAVAMFQECFKYLANHTRKTLAANGRSKPRYFENMCSDVKAYQFCVHSAMETTCKQKLLVSESSKVRMFTRNYFNIYNWSCDLFMGNYEKLDSAQSNKDLACTKAGLLSALKSCAGFLQVRVYPKLDKFVNDAEMSDACSGLTDFQYCSTMQIHKQCVGRNLQVLQDPEILFFTKVIPSDYAWVCTTQSHVEPLCSEERLIEDLKKCYKIIQEKVTPYLHDQKSQSKTVRNEALGLLACRSVLDYQSCVAKKTEHCARSSPLLQKSEVKYYISDVFHMYNWTCYQKALTCRATDVAKSLETCQGFLDIGVLPFSGNNTKLNQIYAACRGTQEFQNCVKNTIWRRCPGSSDALNSAEVMRYTEELFDKFNYTCQATSEMNNVSMCNKDPLEDFKTCTGFLTTKVVASLETIHDTDALVQACRSFLDYRQCIESNYANHCRSKTLPGVTKYLEYTADLYQRYAWTCTVIEPSKGSCRKSEVLQKLHQCLGFITEKVVHISQYQKAPLKLNDACRSLEEFKTCIYTKIFESCPRNAERSSVIRSDEVEHYLEMYKEYKKECDLLSSALQDRTCSEENLYLHYKTCIGFSTMHVDPYIKNMTFPTDSHRSLACSAYKDYSSCLFKKTEDLCGDQNGYVHYDNVRYFMGEVRRKHDRICRATEHECRLADVLDVLSECRGFLLLNEPANPSDTNNYVKATHTCRGLQNFRSCVDTTINDICSKNVLVPKSNEVQEYKELAVLKYKWACEVLAGLKDKECKDVNINHHLRQCSGFLGTVVEPITQDFVSAPEQMELACQFTRYYQQCVQSFLKKRECKNSPLQPDITMYTSDLYYKFAWTCQRPEQCEKAELMKRLKYCRGIITHKVHPFMDDKKNRTLLAKACRGLEDYQLCAMSTSRMYCNNTDTLMSHEVRYYTSDIYEHYKWVCSSSTVAPRCTKSYVVSNMEECLGFLEHMVLPVVQARHKDDFALHSACRGVEYYQQCIQEKSKICANETEFYRTDETKYLMETLYSKYNWTCSTKAESLLCEDNKLLRNLSECLGLISMQVEPLSEDFSNKHNVRLACRALNVYQQCIGQRMQSTCKDNSTLLELAQVREYLTVLPGKYKWVCDSTVEKNAYCDEGDLRTSLAECYGFVRSIVMPNAAQPNVNNRLRTACLGIREYQACIQTRIKAKCEDNEVIPEDAEIRRYMFDVPTKYLWTCEDNQYRSKCTEETFIDSLQECVGFISELVAPLSRKTNDTSKLDSACGSLEAYASCVLLKIKRCDGSPSLMSLSSVKHYTDELYEKYKWVCDVRMKEASQCYNKVLPLFRECVGFINQRTIPNIRMTDDDHRMKIACSGVMAYQKCIESSVERSCVDPRGIENVEDYKYYTQVLFNKYNWICRLDTPKCDPREVLKKLDTCRGFITMNVDPFISDGPVSSVFMQTACAAMNEFRECVRVKLDDRCSNLDSIEGIQEYLLDIPSKYSRVCEVTRISTSCGAEKLLPRLEMCYKILKRLKMPETAPYEMIGNSSTICDAYKQYNICVINEIRQVCGRDRVVARFEKLRPLLQYHYNSFKWACESQKPAGACNEENLKRHLSGCLGFINTRVSLYSYNELNVHDLKHACNAFQDYISCVKLTITSNCGHYFDALQHESLKPYVVEPYKRYKWVCRKLPPHGKNYIGEMPPACNTVHIVNNMTQCLGYLKVRVSSFTRVYNSVAFSRQVCRGLTDYQRCIDSMIPSECLRIKGLLENTEIKYFHSLIYSKYAWICESIPSSVSECYHNVSKLLAECEGFLWSEVNVLDKKNFTSSGIKQSCQGVRDYQACVLSTVKDQCSSNEIIPDTNEVSRLTEDLFRRYQWTCDMVEQTTENRCTSGLLLPKLKECKGFITFEVVPLSADSSSVNNLHHACRALNDFNACVWSEVVKHCDVEKAMDNLSPEVLEYTKGISNTYKWVCDLDKTAVPSCTKDNYMERIRRCRGYIVLKVLPHIEDLSDENQLEIACRAVHDYQSCILKQTKLICPNSKDLLSSESISENTKGLFNEYAWVCNKSVVIPKRKLSEGIKKTCNETELVDNLKSCFGLIKYFVLPHVQTSSKMLSACRGLYYYQKCTSRVISEQSCGKIEMLNESQTVQAHLNLLKKYSFVCTVPENSKLCKISGSRLKECLGILETVVIPSANLRASRRNLSDACNGIQYYDNCIREIHSDHCKTDTLYPPSPDVLEYALDLQIKYRWTCIPRATQPCSLSSLSEKLRRCTPFLTDIALPIKANATATVKEQREMCRAANYYEACVNEEVSDSCSTSSVSTILGEAKEFFQPITEFNKICGGERASASTCTEEALLENIIQCTSIITSVVMPMSSNNNNLGNLKQACKYLRYYENCAASTHAKACPNITLDISTKIQNLTKVLLDKYSWVCSSKAAV
ncbi:uncharacterized protein LOC142566025 [Dermacentor variabilis]|uniref:uncharacterized protein LOC142566025 n=1 Tax=Dermacentor variabilis TaxID=34621 RepID=UPI003F5CAE99